MRMRKKTWAEPFLQAHPEYVLFEPSFKGKWKEQLGSDTLHVEIGTGKGDYINQMSQMYPEIGWVGIEKERNVAAVASKKALEEPRSNELMIVNDAANISDWFEEKEIDVIHLNFSDPWPRNGNRKRRLSHSNFLDKYYSLLSDSGLIIMKTDNKGLFEFSLVEILNHHFSLKEVSVDFRREEHPEDAISEYESRFMEEGQPIYRAIFQVIR